MRKQDLEPSSAAYAWGLDPTAARGTSQTLRQRSAWRWVPRVSLQAFHNRSLLLFLTWPGYSIVCAAHSECSTYFKRLKLRVTLLCGVVPGWRHCERRQDHMQCVHPLSTRSLVYCSLSLLCACLHDY